MRNRSEFTNSDVRHFLANFFDLAPSPILTFSDILAMNEEKDEFKLYSSTLEVDKDGYINYYNLLTATRRFIGIRITKTAWVCTYKELSSDDIKLISSVYDKEKNDIVPVCVDKNQLNLL